MADKSGKGASKVMIYLLLLLTVGGILGSYMMYNDKLKPLQGTTESDLLSAKRLNLFLSPSLKDYYGKVRNGDLKNVDSQVKSETQRRLEELLSSEETGVGVQYNISADIDEGPDFNVNTLKIELEKVTRARMETVWEVCNVAFQEYATISTLDFSLNGRISDEDVKSMMNENAMTYDATFEIVWHSDGTDERARRGGGRT